MKDRDVDTHLRQLASGDSPREAFKQEVLRDSTAEFLRVRRRGLAWRRARFAAAAIFIAGIAFLGGRLSVPRALLQSKDVPPLTADKSDGVSVPNELVAWLDAARLFRQLGMQDRMARAVERAGRLLPADALMANDGTLRVLAAGSTDNNEESLEPMGISGPHPSAESVNQILAQSFGD